MTDPESQGTHFAYSVLNNAVGDYRISNPDTLSFRLVLMHTSARKTTKDWTVLEA